MSLCLLHLSNVPSKDLKPFSPLATVLPQALPPPRHSRALPAAAQPAAGHLLAAGIWSSNDDTAAAAAAAGKDA